MTGAPRPLARRLVRHWAAALLGGAAAAGLAYAGLAHLYESRFTIDFTYAGCPAGGVCAQSATAVTFTVLRFMTNPFLGDTVAQIGGLLQPVQVLQATRLSCSVQPGGRGEFVREKWAKLEAALARGDDLSALVNRFKSDLPTQLLPNVVPCWPGAYHAFRLLVVVQAADPAMVRRLSAAWSRTLTAAIATNPDVAQVIAHAQVSVATFHDLRLERSLGLGAGLAGLGLLVSAAVGGLNRLRRSRGP